MNHTLTNRTNPSLVLVADVGDPLGSVSVVLRLLVDTSTWLDLARLRDGQRWIVAIRYLVGRGDLELLVPNVVVEEFDRNRDRVAATMTTSVASRFNALRQDLVFYADVDEQTRQVVDDLSRHVPLIGAMTTRNFTEIRDLLTGGRSIGQTEDVWRRVVDRGLRKAAPFHRGRNSVADSVLIETYVDEVGGAAADDVLAFVTSNHDDFSLTTGDKRCPHEDLAEAFDGTSSLYALGVDGLNTVLKDYFGDLLSELFDEVDIRDEPRRLGEILAAEKEISDRIWYDRTMEHEVELSEAGDEAGLEHLHRVAGPAKHRVEATYSDPGQLGPYTDYGLGVLEGKMSALRWVLGSEWDFLDT